MADLVSSLLSGVSNAFQGTAPANVNTSQTTTTQAPSQYMGYLSMLGNVGAGALDPNQTLAGNLQQGTPYVAPLTDLQNNIYGTTKGQENTASLLNAPLTALNNATQTVGQDQINSYYNPEVNALNNSLATQTQQAVNNTVLPSLQALGAQTGSTGSSRLLNATGQTLGNIAQGLTSQQNANNVAAYDSAVKNALTEQSQLGTTGGQAMTSTIAGLNAGASLGAQGQAQNQALINAPLQTATSAAGLIKGLTIPTSTTQTYSGPASSYGPSPLSQIASLGSLFATPSGGQSAFDAISSAAKSGYNALFPSTPASTNSPVNPYVGSSGGANADNSVLASNGNDPMNQVNFNPATNSWTDASGKTIDFYE
jgi:hypothetical protein